MRDRPVPCQLEGVAPPAGFEPATVGLEGGTADALCFRIGNRHRKRDSYQLETGVVRARYSFPPPHIPQTNTFVETLRHELPALAEHEALPGEQAAHGIGD